MRSRLIPIPSRVAARERERILEIRGLRKVFSMDQAFVSVLEDIHFSVRRGEMICILGRSGCGKTTLLKILAGFLQPSSGEVLLDGVPVSGPAPDRCVVFQEDALFPWLNVQENIAFGLKVKRRDKKWVRDRVDHFMSLVGLSEFKNYLPGEISGGMKQRVALARVLILEPKVLLMDEPFASLDAQTREEMQKLLLTLWEQLSHTIIFVTHDVSEAILLADRILIMDKNPGRIRDLVPVDLHRPRKRDRGDFLLFSRKVYEVLSD